MNNIFLISFALVLIGGQLGRIQLNNHLAFYLHDCLILIYLVFNLPAIKKSFSTVKIIIKTEKIIVFAFLINVCIAIIYAIIQQTFVFSSMLYTARFVAYLLTIVLLKHQFGGHKIQQLFLNISLAWLALGFVQYFLLPDLTSLYYLGFDDHFYRLTGTLLDPGFLGLIFVFNLLYYLSQKKLTKKHLFFSFLFLLALLLTYSRASYLAYLISATFLFFQLPKKRRIYLLFSISLLLLALPFLPKQSGGEGVKLERSSTIEARFINAREFITHNQKLAILVGQGPFQPQYRVFEDGLIAHAHFADNFFIFLYNSFGLVGASLFIYLLLKQAQQLNKKQQFFSLAILIAWLVHSQFHSNITQGFVILTLWGLLNRSTIKKSTTDDTQL